MAASVSPASVYAKLTRRRIDTGELWGIFDNLMWKSCEVRRDKRCDRQWQKRHPFPVRQRGLPVGRETSTTGVFEL